MKNKHEILIPDATYHIYNRANGNDKLFLSDDNYRYFLEKYIAYVSPIADTFCYCLMPNHFHFLIRIKSENELLSFFKKKEKIVDGFKNSESEPTANLEKLVSGQFSNFFNGYAKAFNKKHNRLGSLFMHTYKRKKIDNTNYLNNLVLYIHFNPLEARLCKALRDWPYSSYNSIISNKETFINRLEVLEWFEDIENFKHVHLSSPSSSDFE
jgi:putative transposase